MLLFKLVMWQLMGMSIYGIFVSIAIAHVRRFVVQLIIISRVIEEFLYQNFNFIAAVVLEIPNKYKKNWE